MKLSTVTPRTQLKKACFLFNVLWTVMFVCAFAWGLKSERASVLDLAEKEALASFNKDLVYRRWAAGHGGVYVPITKATPPNPYLKHLPERDITTASGRNLTLVNPAYMTRQVHELASKQYGVLGHITSLTPLRPENAPDDWERDALLKFSSGADEISSVEVMAGEPYLRYMRRLITEKRCLKCHASQGYKEGDVRGGISVSVPLTPYNNIIAEFQTEYAIILFSIWFLGGVLFNFGVRLLDRQLLKREQAEEDLRASEERYRGVAEDTPVLLCRFRSDGEIDYANTAYCQYFAKTRDELVGQSFLQLIPEGDRTAVMANISKLTVESPTQSHEHKVIAPKGEIRWQRWTNRALFDSQGQIKAFQAIGEDVTERKRQEEAYRKTIEVSIDGYWMVDVNMNILLVNEAYCRMSGYSRDQLLRMTVMDVDAAMSTNQISEKIAEVIRAGAGRFETKHRHKNGHTIDVEISTTYVSQSEAVFYVFIRDISERKIAEEEKEVLQHRLQQALKMQAVGTLAGGIAHEFNNLLGVIMGCSEMAREEVHKDSFVAAQLDNVTKASYRVKELVKQILTFSRQSQQKKIPANLCPLIKDSLKLVQASMPSSVEVYENIPMSCGSALVDPTEVQQIIMNLCSNAVWAMNETGTVEIDLHQTLLGKEMAFVTGIPEGNYVELVFSDTGQGMDEETMLRIFEPFYTRKKVGEGTGMGLSIVYGIMESYGGTITVESEVGKGATFHLYFPLTEEPVVEEAQIEEDTSKGTERILLVDDEEIYAGMAAEMIGRLGYDVDMFTDSRKALDAFKAAPDRYDLIITDQIMPGLSGADLVKNIRTIDPGMPLIVCSGYSTQMDDAKAELLGINAFVHKPIVKREIGKLIRKVLDDS